MSLLKFLTEANYSYAAGRLKFTDDSAHVELDLTRADDHDMLDVLEKYAIIVAMSNLQRLRSKSDEPVVINSETIAEEADSVLMQVTDALKNLASERSRERLETSVKHIFKGMLTEGKHKKEPEEKKAPPPEKKAPEAKKKKVASNPYKKGQTAVIKSSGKEKQVAYTKGAVVGMTDGSEYEVGQLGESQISLAWPDLKTKRLASLVHGAKQPTAVEVTSECVTMTFNDTSEQEARGWIDDLTTVYRLKYEEIKSAQLGDRHNGTVELKIKLR